MFVNGIPLVIGEAKTPVRPAVTWFDAAHDINVVYENAVPQLFVPNVFSPNGDGVNDEVKVEAYGLRDVLWSVFSRFGEKVFETNSLDVTWDGTHRGKTLNPGVFVVHVVYTDQATGEAGERISTVTLMR